MADNGGTPGMTTAVRAVALTLAIMSTTVCGLRLYVRKFIVRSFGLDDWLVVVALFLVNGYSILSMVISYYGLGHRVENVPPQHLLVWMKIYYVALCTYLLVGFAVKSSLAVFIMRIFPQRYIRFTSIGMITFMAVFTISGEIALALQCRPVQAFWDKTILQTNPDAACYSADVLFGMTMYQGVVMFVCDAILFALPMRPTWKLQMDLKKRVLVLCLFGFGFIACAAALVRFSTLLYTKSDDITYNAATSLIWMELEFNMGIIAGSLSSLVKLVRIRGISSAMGTGYTSTDGPSNWSQSLEMDSNNNSSTNNKNNSRKSWKQRGITKTSETMVTVDSRQNESQERIMPPTHGQGQPSSSTYATPS